MSIITISGRRVKRPSVILISGRSIWTRQAKALAPWAGPGYRLTEIGADVLAETRVQPPEAGEMLHLTADIEYLLQWWDAFPSAAQQDAYDRERLNACCECGGDGWVYAPAGSADERMGCPECSRGTTKTDQEKFERRQAAYRALGMHAGADVREIRRRYMVSSGRGEAEQAYVAFDAGTSFRARPDGSLYDDSVTVVTTGDTDDPYACVYRGSDVSLPAEAFELAAQLWLAIQSEVIVQDGAMVQSQITPQSGTRQLDENGEAR